MEYSLLIIKLNWCLVFKIKGEPCLYVHVLYRNLPIFLLLVFHVFQGKLSCFLASNISLIRISLIEIGIFLSALFQTFLSCVQSLAIFNGKFKYWSLIICENFRIVVQCPMKKEVFILYFRIGTCIKNRRSLPNLVLVIIECKQNLRK